MIAIFWYCSKSFILNHICWMSWNHGYDTDVNALLWHQHQMFAGNDCSGVQYGDDANMGLPWSDQTCALLNGPVTGIHVWKMPNPGDGWTRGWVFENWTTWFIFGVLSTGITIVNVVKIYPNNDGIGTQCIHYGAQKVWFFLCMGYA